MARHKGHKGPKVHKTHSKMGRKRKLTVHGGFKAVEHKASHKEGGRKRHGGRRKRA